MMKGHEVKRASDGEPLVVLKDEFGLLLCFWNKKRFSGDPGGLFFRPSSLDVISGPISDTSAFLVATMKSMSYHCLQAFGRRNANRTTGNSEKRQTYSQEGFSDFSP